MTLEYTKVGQVKTTTLDYIDKILNAFDKADPTGGGTKSSDALAILLKVKKYCKKLNSKQAVEFHHLAVKILFANKRAMPETCTTISLLTTRVREPENDD